MSLSGSNVSYLKSAKFSPSIVKRRRTSESSEAPRLTSSTNVKLPIRDCMVMARPTRKIPTSAVLRLRVAKRMPSLLRMRAILFRLDLIRSLPTCCGVCCSFCASCIAFPDCISWSAGCWGLVKVRRIKSSKVRSVFLVTTKLIVETEISRFIATPS